MSGSFFGAAPFGGSSIGFEGQNAPNINNHNLRAVLFLFNPHRGQFQDVGMRPFQYSFDGNFMSDVSEITDLSKTGGAGMSALLTDFMGRHNCAEHMVPSYEVPMLFNASRLEDKYRFILVLTEKGTGLTTGNTLASSVGSSQIRRIYSGYFTEEPYNPLTVSGAQRTLNPNGMMVITHKTVVGTSTEFGAHGARTRVDTRASEEFINPIVASGLMSYASGADQDLYLMTPKNIVSSIETSSEGYSYGVPGAESNLNKDKNSSVMSDVLEQPTHNVAQVIKGMMKHRDDTIVRGRAMTGRVDAFYENDMLAEDAARMNLGRFMDIPRYGNSTPFDLDENRPYSAKTISDMVNGDLDVQDFNLPRPQFYDTADQTQVDLTGQYSSFIAMVVPPILNSVGLNSMSFIYEVKHSYGQVMDNFIIGDAEPHWNLPVNDGKIMALAAEVELKKGIFSAILSSMGSFRVEVRANTTGNTVVRLDLIDQGLRCMADFEVPSCLGGLISPLIGNSRVNHHNSEQLTGLYSIASGISGNDSQMVGDGDFTQFSQGQFQQQVQRSLGYPDVLSD